MNAYQAAYVLGQLSAEHGIPVDHVFSGDLYAKLAARHGDDHRVRRDLTNGIRKGHAQALA